MYEILEKAEVAPNIIFMRSKAPKIARSAKPGQFVIIRVDEKGERIPMGLSGWNEKDGTIDILFYVLGTSTSKLAVLKPREAVVNIAGPLALLPIFRNSAQSYAFADALASGQLCPSLEL